jgi:hypothetical protein
MVLLLAAAYTYYTHTRQQQQQQQQQDPSSSAPPDKDKDESIEESNIDDRTSTSIRQSQSTTPRDRLKRHVQQGIGFARSGGSGLVQQAFFRCSGTESIDTEAVPVGVDCNSPSSSVVAAPLMDHAGADVSESSLSAAAAALTTALDMDMDVFRPAVREEWIHAVFGKSFFAADAASSYHAPRQGVGLSGIPSFVTYQSTIAASSVTAKSSKVGVTISRFPLGLYVRLVEPGSEAFFAGIQQDSVLVDVSGMAMLVEPSRQAIERLWQYEGHFQETNDNDSLYVDRNHHADGGVKHGNVETVREPVALTFIKNGALYTVMMLSSPPWGISWAPCGNFPLVKRSYSLAAEAGVRPGSLVAAVNGKSFREMDHAATAMELRDLFQSGQEIRMTLCFTPVAARTGHYEKLSGLDGKRKVNQSKPRVALKTNDGVEVKFHPWEYAIGGLCTPNMANLDMGAVISGSVQELADKVTAGQVEAPCRVSPQKRSEMETHSHSRWTPKEVYGPCPTLSNDELLEKWDPIDALMFCLQFHGVAYDEENFVAELDKRACKSQIEIFQGLTVRPDAAEMVGTFLLQFISLICAPDHDPRLDKDDRKSEAGSSSTGNPSRKNANQLTGMLLKLSRRNEGFCQRLYFLLRSYISTLETRLH